MKFAFGMSAFASDGEEVGLVREVVVDPRTREVTHLVIQEGLLFQRDRVVPMSLVDRTDESGVRLRVTPAGVETTADEYRKEEYVRLSPAGQPSEEVPEMLWTQPPGRGVSLVPPGIRPYDMGPDAVIPGHDIALLHGSDVVTDDGKMIGSVEALMTDDDRRITHLIISAGIVFAEKKVVPLAWVRKFEDNAVLLAVPSETVRQLPDYQEP